MAVMFRLASIDDAGALAELAAATFPLACPPDAPQADIADFIANKLSQAAFTRYLQDPAVAIFVAESDAEGSAELLAYTLLIDATSQDADVVRALGGAQGIELSKFYALPIVHGQGISQALMDASVEWAVSRKAQLIWLGVNQENQRAQKFYGKHGFAIAGEKRFTLGGRVEDDFVMVRTL